MSNTQGWTEVYDGDSSEAEENVFRRLAFSMLDVQESNRGKAGATAPARTLHAKIVAGLTAANLMIDDNLPAEFSVDWFRPGTSHQTAVRFSNASGIAYSDSSPDMRGAALKVTLPDGG